VPRRVPRAISLGKRVGALPTRGEKLA
jgi:hypothetical protein